MLPTRYVCSTPPISEQHSFESRSVCTNAGAEQITLEGVYHSPLGAGTGDSRPWYGSPGVIERWIRVVYDDMELDEKYSVEIGDMVQQ